jgi:hypothetical protein
VRDEALRIAVRLYEPEVLEEGSPIADLLTASRDSIEKCRLAGIGISGQGQGDDLFH